MPIYETVLIARQELSTSQVDALVKDFCKVLEDEKGKILKTENWGLRTFAYKIEKSRKGHYALIESEVAGPAIIEMERRMRLSDDVMRYMTIKLKKATDGPSVMAQPEKEAA